MHRQHGQVVARGDAHAELSADFIELCQVFIAGGGIGHNAVGGFGFVHAVDNQVVHHAACFVEHGRIQRFADKAQLGHIVGQQLLQPGAGLVAHHIAHQHVRYVEHTGIGAHRFVFFDLGAVMNRQIPAGKVNHFAAGGHMGRIEWGVFGFGHAQFLL